MRGPSFRAAAGIALAILAAGPASAGSRYLARAAWGGGGARPGLPTGCIAPPPLPLPAGAKLIGHGDSILGLGNTAGTNALSSKMDSILATAWAADPRFAYENWYDPAAPFAAINPWNGANQGIAGDHLDWSNPSFGDGILPRTRYTLARGPAIVYLQGGGNSINSGDGDGRPVSAAYAIDRLDATINHFTCRGVWVILQTILPDGYWASGDPRHQTIRDVNVWIRQQAGRTGVRVIDPYDAFVSPTDPDAVRQPLYNEQINLAANPPVYGGVHPNQAGAWLIVRDYLKPLLAQMVQPGSTFSQDATDTNAVTAAVALMNGGATGAKAGTVPPTGSVAAGWTATAARGSSAIVASLDTSNAGYTRQVFVVTPVADGYTDGTGGAHELDLAPPAVSLSPSVPAGGWVRGYIHVETPDMAIGTSASTVYMDVTLFNAASQTIASSRAMSVFTPQAGSPNFGRGGYWLAVPPMQVPATGPATKLTMKITTRWPKAQGGSFTMKFDRFIVRQVPDPRPAWNL